MISLTPDPNCVRGWLSYFFFVTTYLKPLVYRKDEDVNNSIYTVKNKFSTDFYVLGLLKP